MFLRKNFFYFAMLMIASVFVMPSCSEDDDVTGGDNPPAVDVPNPAGDDFYMYVNEDWHKSLTETGETQGYSFDMDVLMAERTTDIIQTMPEIQTVAQLVASAQDNKEAIGQRVDEIITDLMAGILNKDDAYRVIGKCASMGLMDDFFKLYLVFTEEDGYCYTIGPKEFPMDEEGAGIHSMNNINFKKFKKVSAQSRSVNRVLTGIIEGIGLGDEYLMFDEEVCAEALTDLNKLSLDDLKKFIKNCSKGALLPFYSDEYVQELLNLPSATAVQYFTLEAEQLFKYSISREFGKRYVTAETKAKFKEYGEELRSVFAKRIENNTWLSAQTKQAAMNKLAKMKFYFGEPDEWLEEGLPAPKGESLVDDILEVKASRTRLIQAKLGKDYRDDSMTLIMFMPGGDGLNVHQAMYTTINNAMNLFPAFMMEPEYSPNMDASSMYAVFSVMGHEMTHGFDIEGAEYDADGNEANWWAADDKAKFQALNNKFIKQMSSFEVAPGVMANGELTIGENVADLGGLNIAFDALTEHLTKKGITGNQLVDAQKKFFEHYAYRYRTQYSEVEFLAALADEHGVNKLRVNGIVQHMDSWYNLYNVEEGDSLYLSKEDRVVIW